MEYKILEDFHDSIVTHNDVVALDSYLSTLSSTEGDYLYPEQLSSTLNISEEKILHFLLHCSSKHITSTRYEAYCPNEEVGFFHTFSKEDLTCSQECSCVDSSHVPKDDCEIYVSFRLNEIKNHSKKKLHLCLILPLQLFLQQVHLLIHFKKQMKHI